jgi:NTP pyrophosphatase (non-canonical NTP hydrolase)
MDLAEYLNGCLETWGGELEKARAILGLTEEAGEVAGKFKKYLRGDYEGRDEFFFDDLEKELGDTLYYVCVASYVFGCDINVIAKKNLEKLASRKKRGVIKGSGDER